MLNALNVRRIILAQWCVDFRKGHTGLLGECRIAGFEPWSGDCVVFISRCRTRLKLLYADQTGLWVDYKVFSKGSLATEIEFLEKPHTKSLSSSDLAMLLDGNSYKVIKRKTTWKPSHLDRSPQS